MLVLSREKNEAICIGNNIKVVVVEIRGDKVRLGIEAPTEIPVHRDEVFNAIVNAGSQMPDLVGVAGRQAVLTQDEQDAILRRDGQLGSIAETIKTTRVIDAETAQ